MINRSNTRFLTILLIVTVLVFAFGAMSTQAATSTALGWNVTCEGFNSTGGSLTFDRDNTGRGEEAFYIRATDGVGNVIYQSNRDSVPVGTSIFIDSSVFFRYSVIPVANPITVAVVSPSGNGFSAQTLASSEGNCATIVAQPQVVPVTTQVPNVVTASGTGTTVPLPVGTPIVAPVNEPPGYLIVNFAGQVNIRSGDGTQYTIVGQVTGGDVLEVLGVNQARTWWFIQFGTLRGWINNTLIINRGDLSGIPVVVASGEIYPPRFYLYRNNFLTVSPSSRSLKICAVPGNWEYVIVGKNSAGSWLAVEAECNESLVTGWINVDAGAIRNSGDLPIPVIRR